MENREKFERNIDEILNSLDGITRAKPAFNFQQRVLNEMYRRQEIPSTFSWPFSPQLSIGALSLFAILNIFTLLKFNAQTASSSKKPGIESVMRDYNLGTSSVYDSNN